MIIHLQLREVEPVKVQLTLIKPIEIGAVFDTPISEGDPIFSAWLNGDPRLSNWEADGDAIKPKDGKSVDASHIIGTFDFGVFH